MSDLSINRPNFYNGITRLDKGNNTQKPPEDSINLGRFDTVDVKKPELILSDTHFKGADRSYDAIGAGYPEGEQTLDDVKSTFQNKFEMYLGYNIDGCRTSLANKEDVKAILNSVFRQDYFTVIDGALGASVEKGREFGKGVFYSADDYYMAEDMTNALKDAYNEICAKYGIEDTTLPDVPYKTYNDWWGKMASGQILFDAAEAGPPPEGLEIFYAFDSNKQQSSETGHITVRCGDWRMDREITFNFLTKNYFAGGNALAKSWDSNQAVKDYFSNFTFRSNLSAWAYKYDGATPRLNQII